jgi:hypothetical protein
MAQVRVIQIQGHVWQDKKHRQSVQVARAKVVRESAMRLEHDVKHLMWYILFYVHM